MPLRPLRPLLLLSAAALAPIALGIAMHLDHLAAAEACTADLAEWTSTPTPVAPVSSVVPHTLPIPVPLAEPIEHALPFAFVVDLDGPHIVLAGAVDEDWAASEPEFRNGEKSTVRDGTIWRSVAAYELPVAILANVGRTVRVYSADGEACTARIGAPKLVSELWGEVQNWAPEPGDGEPLSATEAWEVGRRTLVAPLETQGDCGTPLWARDLALPAPAVFVRTDGAVPRAARKAVFRDPAMRALASEYSEYATATSSESPTLAEGTTGQRWLDPRGRELFTFSIFADSLGCGSFGAAWAAFVPAAEIRRGRALGTDSGVTALDRDGDEVIAVFDLERDGRIEALSTTWLGPTRLVEVGGEDARRERAMLDPVPFLGCPC